MKAVTTLSGGLDSTTLLYWLLDQGHEVVKAVSFDYGQRHLKELEYAKATAEKLGVQHTTIALWRSGLTEALSSSESSLVTDNDVPEGHYAQENMKSTVVPNRNMIMISIAGAIAVAEGANIVATAVHAGDHFIYPDCRPEFIRAASSALARGNEGFGVLDTAPVRAPFINVSKADIALKALELGVPLHETWSCYKGGEMHCGRCGTCVERLEAIHNALADYDGAAADGTPYEDPYFWKEAVASR